MLFSPQKVFFFWFCRIQTQANLILIYIFVGKVSYSRDFLISLANCAESRKKPEFLPEYSIVLTKAVSLEWALFKMIVQLYWMMSQTLWAERCRTPKASRNVVEWRKRRNVSFIFRTQWLYITLTFIVLIISLLFIYLFIFTIFRVAERSQSWWENLQKCSLNQRTVTVSFFGFCGGFNLVLFICMFVFFCLFFFFW